MAQSPPGPDGSAVLCVLAGGETLRLPLLAVREVLRPLPLTRMPGAPAFLLGLCNLRGTALPVVSLQALRGGAGEVQHGEVRHGGVQHVKVQHGGVRETPVQPTGPTGFGIGARVVVAVAGSNRIGLLVDAVLPADTPDAHRLDLDALLLALPGHAARAGASVAASVAASDADDADPAVPAAAEPRAALLGFRIGAREFALRLDAVLSVAVLGSGACAAVAEPRPEKLAGTDAAMLGVIDARGGLLPVLDAAVLLGLEPREHAAARLVVARINQRPAGLAVDALTGILRPPAGAIEPVPPLLLRGIAGEARIDAICRLENGGRLVQVLHPDRLLDQPTMQRLFALDTAPDATPDATSEGDAGAAGGERERLLLFGIGAERYGLPMASVLEVLRHPGSLTPMPHAPPFVEGATVRRGRVLAVLDGRRRFGLPAGGAEQPRRILVVSAGGLQLGLAVDQHTSVAWCAVGAMSPAPDLATEHRLFNRVATLHGGDMVLLVDPEALLAGAERDWLAAMAPCAGPAQEPEPAGARAAS